MSFFEKLSTSDEFYKDFVEMESLCAEDTWSFIENILKSNVIEKEVVDMAFSTDEEFVELLKEYRTSKSFHQTNDDIITTRIANIRNIIRVTFVAAAILRSCALHAKTENFSLSDFCEKVYPGKNNIVDAAHLITSDIQYMMCVLFSNTDFFVSPASTMFHGDWYGGLVDHSLAVLEVAMSTYKTYGVEECSPIWFILHDLCKCNCYELINKSKKNPDTGKWETVKSWSTRKDYTCIPHGAESVVRIQDAIMCCDSLNWMKLHFTKKWKIAIAYHMGMYNIGEIDKISYNNAVKSYPEILLMHHADMVASQIWGI